MDIVKTMGYTMSLELRGAMVKCVDRAQRKYYVICVNGSLNVIVVNKLTPPSRQTQLLGDRVDFNL